MYIYIYYHICVYIYMCDQWDIYRDLYISISYIKYIFTYNIYIYCIYVYICIYANIQDIFYDTYIEVAIIGYIHMYMFVCMHV